MKILKMLDTQDSRASLLTAKHATLLSKNAVEPGIKVRSLLQSSTTWVGQPIIYPTTKNPEVSICKIEIPPRQETGWHIHPVPSFIYVLSGRLLLDTQKTQKEFRAGQVFIESIHLPHNGKNLGPEPVVLLVIYAGIKDQPHTEASSYPVRAHCCKPSEAAQSRRAIHAQRSSNSLKNMVSP